jgi:UDP-glucose 4-epimerase
MKILVTGGAGFIGSHIVEQFLMAGHQVTILDSLWSEGGGRRAHVPSGTRFYEADITNAAALESIFDEVKPEIVCHQAAQHSVSISAKNPQLDAQVNVIGLLNILTNCTRVGVRKILCASSGATYGTAEQLPITEETPQHPESPYGITKMIMEYYLRYWQQAHGLTYTALRYGNVFGPRQDPNGEAGVIAIFAKRFLQKEPVRIDWDGGQQKDYVYVADVARANLLALEHGDNDIFCIASGQGTSVNTIYTTLAEITGYRPEIIHAPKRSGDIYLSYFDSSKAARILDWRPEASFVDGVRKTVAFFQ